MLSRGDTYTKTVIRRYSPPLWRITVVIIEVLPHIPAIQWYDILPNAIALALGIINVFLSSPHEVKASLKLSRCPSRLLCQQWTSK